MAKIYRFVNRQHVCGPNCPCNADPLLTPESPQDLFEMLVARIILEKYGEDIPPELEPPHAMFDPTIEALVRDALSDCPKGTIVKAEPKKSADMLSFPEPEKGEAE